MSISQLAILLRLSCVCLGNFCCCCFWSSAWLEAPVWLSCFDAAIRYAQRCAINQVIVLCHLLPKERERETVPHRKAGFCVSVFRNFWRTAKRTDEAKVAHLKAHGEGKVKLVEVPDITKEKGFAALCAGAYGLLHVASPGLILLFSCFPCFSIVIGFCFLFCYFYFI